jgi:nitroimidazol reductase NimA-like FMN-containing flavoprotein (pyridoxamine 5'-phosphate oxidase superfamily)
LNESQSVQSDIKALLCGQHLAVLSTRSADGHPYASLVAVVAEADLAGIYFATSRATRKFANLTAEPRVALLVENSRNRQSDIYEAMAVTAVGTVHELGDQEAAAILPLYLERHPQLKSFVTAPSTALLHMAVKTYYLVNRFQKVMEYHVGR